MLILKDPHFLLASAVATRKQLKLVSWSWGEGGGDKSHGEQTQAAQPGQ